MLSPALLELYNRAVAAHPLLLKAEEAEVLAAIQRHREAVDTIVTKLINALERGDTETIKACLGSRDLRAAEAFHDFRAACFAEVYPDLKATFGDISDVGMGIGPVNPDLRLERVVDLARSGAISAEDALKVITAEAPGNEAMFHSEAPAEPAAQPVAEPLVPAEPPLLLDAPLVLPTVDGLDPRDAQPGKVDEPSTKKPVAVLGDKPKRR